MAYFLAHSRKKFQKRSFGPADVKELHGIAEKYLKTDAGKHFFWLRILRHGDPLVSKKFREYIIKREILNKMGIDEDRFNQKMVELNPSLEKIHQKEDIENYDSKIRNYYEEVQDKEGEKCFFERDYEKAAEKFLDANQFDKYQVSCELGNLIEASVEAGAFTNIGNEMKKEIAEKINRGTQREKDTYEMITEDFGRGNYLNLADYYRKNGRFAEAGWLEAQISLIREAEFHSIMNIEAVEELKYEQTSMAMKKLDSGLRDYERSLNDLKTAFITSKNIDKKIEYGNAHLFLLKKLKRLLKSAEGKKSLMEYDLVKKIRKYEEFYEKEKKETKKMLTEAINTASETFVYRNG